MLGEPSLANSAFSANISSTVARSPTIAPIRDGDAALTLPAIGGERLRPARGLERAVDAHVRAVEPLRLKPIDDVPRLVGDPFLVDRIVDARQDAHDLAAARIDPDRGAQRIHDVDRIRS